MKIYALGIDLGKTVFHLVGLDASGQVVVRKRCSRTQLLAFTANLQVQLIGMEAISYGSVYVARVAMGSSDTHTVKAFLEAEAYPGPSLIIAYSHCIAHGYDMAFDMSQQKSAVLSGYWPLIRYNPQLRAQGKNPFQLDSKAPTIPLRNYIYEEARYSMLARSHPDHARELLQMAQDDVERQWRVYEGRAAMNGEGTPAPEEPAETASPVAKGGEDE
jgi:pyruvate-ferredoxin/flavodoxin oxidoreductase